MKFKIVTGVLFFILLWSAYILGVYEWFDDEVKIENQYDYYDACDHDSEIPFYDDVIDFSAGEGIDLVEHDDVITISFEGKYHSDTLHFSTHDEVLTFLGATSDGDIIEVEVGDLPLQSKRIRVVPYGSGQVEADFDRLNEIIDNTIEDVDQMQEKLKPSKDRKNNTSFLMRYFLYILITLFWLKLFSHSLQ